MRGVIIINQDNSHNLSKIKRLKEEAALLHLDLDVIVNDGTIAYIDKNGKVITSLKCDFIIYLDKDYYLAKMLEQAGYTLFNDPKFLKLCDDKMLTYITLSNHGIRMPLTMSAPLIYRDYINEENYLFLDKVIKTIGLPLVVKKVYGSLGEGVYLANNKEELKEIYCKNFMYPLLFQSYVENSKGRSARVIVIDEKIVGAFERYNSKDFRSNYGGSASSRPLTLNKKQEEFVKRIASLLHIKYAGIDLLFDNDEPILCEINSNAFFEEFEKVTGINVAKQYLEMIVNTLKK